LVVQKAFYPEGEVCHSYLIHPPGGVVGGDEINLEIKVESCAHALITTPAANKFYRSSGKIAHLKQTLRVGENALMEWLPQESIVYEGSQVNMSTLVNLTATSRFIGWEVTCLGRPASGDHYKNGSCFQRLEISVDGKPRLLDRIVLDNNNGFRNGPWGMGNNEVMAALVVYPANKENLQAVRNYISNINSEMLSLGVSLLGNLLICRGLANEAATIRAALEEIWAVLRPEIMCRPACPPRIWNM
jgi:urease accessory protein